MDPITIKNVVELGWPYAIVLLGTYGLKRLWNSAWPWFTEVYWPAREERWKTQFEANQLRDERLADQSMGFLRAIENFQNGFTHTNSQQHEAIITALDAIALDLQRNTELMESLMNDGRHP